MTIDGVWTGEFYGPYGWENNGVYVLEGGRIIGGNDRHRNCKNDAANYGRLQQTKTSPCPFQRCNTNRTDKTGARRNKYDAAQNEGRSDKLGGVIACSKPEHWRVPFKSATRSYRQKRRSSK